MSLSIPSDITDAVKDVRKDKSSTDFCLVTYDTDTSLRLVASGAGGLSALRDALVEDVCYGLLRLEYEYETVGVTRTETTKFIFVYYRPDNISIKRKMKIGVFDGQVKKIFTPHHTSFEVSTPDELTDDAILELVGNVTSRATHATEEKGTAFFVGGKRMSQKKEKRKSKSKEKGYDTMAQGVKGANVNFPDLDQLKECIEDVRNEDSATQWCVFGYEGKEDVVFKEKGEGDVSNLLAACGDKEVNYGLLRFTEKIDKTVAVRFCFIVWTPDGVSPTTKARVSTHKGAVTPLFRPFQVDFYVTQRDEISMDSIISHMSGLSGTRSHETSRPKSVKRDKYERKMLGGVTKELQNLSIDDEDALKAAIKSVRDDKNDTTWVVATHEGSKKKDMKLVLTATGSGGIDALNAQFQSGKVMYGLLRYTQIIDKSETIKFLMVHYQAEDVSPTVKGNTGVLKGAVSALFSPFHAERFVSTPNELSEKDLKKMFEDKKAKW